MMDTAIVPQTEARNITHVVTDSRGVTWYYCATAQQYFIPDQPPTPRGGMVWVVCALCDAYGRVKNRDPRYDADEPQPHGYLVEDC